MMPSYIFTASCILKTKIFPDHIYLLFFGIESATGSWRKMVYEGGYSPMNPSRQTLQKKDTVL